MAAADPGTIVAIIALLGTAGAGITAFLRIGPQRQTDLVTAQDMVIENLRQDMTAQRDYFERKLEDERNDCDRKIARLQVRVSELEARLTDIPGSR